MQQRPSAALLVLLILLLAMGTAVITLAQSGTNSYYPLVVGPETTPTFPPTTPLVKINFQPAAANIPQGYLPDSGLPFGERGNGFSYGWQSDNSATTRERNSSNAPDQRYDTLIHLQRPENPTASWEIALPAGTYVLYLVAGDPDFTDGAYLMQAEQQLVMNGVPTTNRRFIESRAVLAVHDGRLTISSAPGAQNNKLAFLEIHVFGEAPPSPTPTPTPSPSPPGEMVEFRGLWVTRFDWTRSGRPADPAKIDEIVDNAARAGFNAIFFQVRGTADAYYTPGLEPWAQRVSGGTLGQPPSPPWDPLAYFIEKAHNRGIQLHAYLNVHPVTDDCNNPPPETTPRHLYYLLRDVHGTTDGKLNGVQWTSAGQLHCSVYLRATPASLFFDQHLLAVAGDLVTRYAIDGLHLDNVRYGGRTTSCDPVSEAAFGAPCFSSGGQADYEAWQRQQLNATIRKLYDQVVVPSGRKLWLSAAVWPIYRDYWGWGGSEGYSDYYQDSKAWVGGGYMDSISPMIYPGAFNCPDNSFWTQERWRILVTDFQASGGGRYVIPGIGAGYCTFDEISSRIEMARAIGVAGHALFSYQALFAFDYFDELAAGPYAIPAVAPDISWHD